METLNLDHRNPPTEVAGWPAALQTALDQLCLLSEGTNQRLDEMLSLMRAHAEGPSPRPGRASSLRVWCLACGAENPADLGSCSGCGGPLRDLCQLAREELHFELPPQGGRFGSRGWELVGLSPVECPTCLEQLFCAVRPYQTHSGQQKYWALLCRRCASLTQVSNLRREHKDALNGWARAQARLSSEPETEREKPLSPTLQATWQALQSGSRPEQIALDRGLAVATIYGHLGLLVQLGRYSLEELVSPEIVECIVQAHARFPRPLDLADLETRLPLPVLRQDVMLVAQARGLEMGLGDPVDADSVARVRSALRSAIETYDGRMTTRDLLGVCLGTDAYRSGAFANRAFFATLRGYSHDALAAELRAMAREGEITLTAGKKLAVRETLE